MTNGAEVLAACRRMSLVGEEEQPVLVPLSGGAQSLNGRRHCGMSLGVGACHVSVRAAIKRRLAMRVRSAWSDGPP